MKSLSCSTATNTLNHWFNTKQLNDLELHEEICKACEKTRLPYILHGKVQRAQLRLRYGLLLNAVNKIT